MPAVRGLLSVRILHVVPSYWPAVRYGGPIVSVHGLARAQAGLGHHVEVFTTNVDGPSVSDVPIGRIVVKDDVGITYFPTGWGRRVYRSPAMRAALHSRVAEFDVVHVHSVFLWPTIAACKEAALQRRPFVLSPRGMLVPDLIQRKSSTIKNAWLAIYGGATVRKANILHATSEVEASDIRRLNLGERRIAVVSNGVDVDGVSDVRRAFLSGHPRFVSIGRINWKKGLDKLIETLLRIPTAELVIAGPDDDGHKASLESAYASAGVAQRVKFLGPVHGVAKWKLLSDADLFLAPSLSENFGNAVLEAMAAGTPVVVTPEVGLAETVRRSGAGLVVEGDPLRLAREIAELVDRPHALEAMSAAGRRLARDEFSWQSIAQQMNCVYVDATPSRVV